MSASMDSVNSTHLSEDFKSETDDQTIKVYLRLKPFPPEINVSKEQSEAFSIINSTTLETKITSLEKNNNCLKKLGTNRMEVKQFKFTKTFGPETSQMKIFDEAVKMQMIEFLDGKSSVVMTYGTTSSGKTFTLQGTAESPGLIPRGIEFIFNNINPLKEPVHKPENQCDVIYLNLQERIDEFKLKSKLLNNANDKNLHTNTYKMMQKFLNTESTVSPNQNYNDYNSDCSIWISFAEIYNEIIYDLIQPNLQEKRPALKLAMDRKGKNYIKGLTSVYVTTASEAYQIFLAGQRNLQTASTTLNSKSSRSHCIFTIKLLKYGNKSDSYSVDVSTFTFCDLAGSERLKKTLNIGERLVEAKNINKSLLILRRCLRSIYDSQYSTNKISEPIGPFRESQLTRLFQRALMGKERVSMIVTINPEPILHKESLCVLEFTAIVKKIVTINEPIKTIKKSVKTNLDWKTTELDVIIEKRNEETYENLAAENKRLKKELEQLKGSVLKRDMETRKELIDMFTNIINEIEDRWRKRLNYNIEAQKNLRYLAVKRIKSFYEKKINQLHESMQTKDISLAAQQQINTDNDVINQSNKRVQIMKTSLNEDKEEYLNTINENKELQELLKDNNEFIAEYLKQIIHLREQLNQAKAYSRTQNIKIKNLEKKADQLYKEFNKTQEKAQIETKHIDILYMMRKENKIARSRYYLRK